MSWQRTLNWASWPRTYVAGLFDVPNTDPPVPALVPVADWLRVRIQLNGKQLVMRRGTMLRYRRTLDMRRGLLVVKWRHRDPSGIVAEIVSLRLVSQDDRALGLQWLNFEVDRDDVDVTLEASFEAAGLGMEPAQIERELGVWRITDGSKSVAMAGAPRLTLGGNTLRPDAVDRLRWAWHWRSVAGQRTALERLVAVVRSDEPDRDPGQAATAALQRARNAGGEAVLAAHASAWAARWHASDVTIDGAPELERELRFAVYHLNSAANPHDPRVSIGARALTGDAYLGHVFWDTEIYLLPFYIATWPEAARALLMYRFHTLAGARANAAKNGWRGAQYAWESADTGEETTPERVLTPGGQFIDVLSGKQEHHITADVAYAVWQYLARERRRHVPARGGSGNRAGDGAVLGEPGRAGSRRQAAYPPCDGARRIPRGRRRQRLHQRDGALEHLERAGRLRVVARTLAGPVGRPVGEACPGRGRTRALARGGENAGDGPRSGDRDH